MFPAIGSTAAVRRAGSISASPTAQRAMPNFLCCSGPCPSRCGFEATGGQEWVLWTTLVAAGVEAVQLPPAQIKAFALSRGTRAKTDRIDAELIARFMLFRPEAGRRLPEEKLRILRALTTRRAQVVDRRKRLSAQISARRKQNIPADLEGMPTWRLRWTLRSVTWSGGSEASSPRRRRRPSGQGFCCPSPGSGRSLRPCLSRNCRSSGG